MSIKPAAVGFRVHSGWTALVAIAVEKGQPVVLVRRRPHLVENFSYTFRQPYHTAAKMSLDEATAFLRGQRSEARRLAVAALRSAESDVAQQGYRLKRVALLLAAGHPLPDLAKILTSHSLIHTADGEFFRKALLHASARRKLAVTTLKERQLLPTASAELRRKPAALGLLVANIGRPLGSPWAQDEKFAVLAAWLTLRA